MLVYLDMCCLKRPFDDQSQPRIRLESEALLAFLALASAEVRFVRSPALLLENALNPNGTRAARVGEWLAAEAPAHADSPALQQRTADLMRLGFKNFDALHVSSAEQAGADFLATFDDRMLAVAERSADRLKVKVVGIVELAREIIK